MKPYYEEKGIQIWLGDCREILPSLEPVELGHAISAMLADRAMLERMRHNALAASERELRWDIEQQRLLTLYQEVLGIQRERPAQTRT